MTAPVVRSISRLCNALFTVYALGAIDLQRVSLLNAHHRAARLAWAGEHKDWSQVILVERFQKLVDLCLVVWQPLSRRDKVQLVTWSSREVGGRGRERGGPDHSQIVLRQNWDGTEQIRTAICMVLKAKYNDRRKILALSHDEFRGP
ncbi:hypothetical protein TNCV_3449551 [Trichonephila clavipes]|nr:hypothetical protein TNCV_3449551 [Trichonephila clavipes]